MISSHSIVQTGVNVVATTTASTVQIPFDSSAGRPRYIRIASTAAAYVKVGNSDVVAVAGDLLVQPADSVMLIAAGCNYISVLALTGTCSVSIAPTDDGRWDSASPDALDVLRYYGSNAHIYLPGVGMLNGLQAGNYLDSAGTTQGTVDQPVGLVLDAAGGLGVELVTNGVNLVDTSGWTSVGGGAQSATGGKLRRDPLGTSSGSYQDMTAVAGKVYKVSAGVTAISGSGAIGLYAYAGGSFATPLGSNIAIGSPSFFITASTSSVRIYLYADGTKITDFDNISVREVTGIHASQPTTSNKCILRQTGGRYNWVFDATDLLTATFPAGNESVTVIDALGTGQVTTTGVNVVGAYSMGPSVTLYGRMIVKGTLSASDLALLQGFANRLVGL